MKTQNVARADLTDRVSISVYESGDIAIYDRGYDACIVLDPDEFDKLMKFYYKHIK